MKTDLSSDNEHTLHDSITVPGIEVSALKSEGGEISTKENQWYDLRCMQAPENMFYYHVKI